MTRPHRPRLPEISPSALPRVALAGVAMALVAILLGGYALLRVVQLADAKADKASADARSAQEVQRYAVCGIADFSRLGNAAVAPPTTDRGRDLAVLWQSFYDAARCGDLPRDPNSGRITVPPTAPGG